jgi:hypothetical protein
LLNKNEDFLENENFFMMTQILQLVNINISLCGALVIEIESYREDYHDKPEIIQAFFEFFLFRKIPMQLAIFGVWVVIYWQGTKFEQLFSKRNMIILLSLGFFDIVTDVCYLIYSLVSLTEDAREIGIIILCCLLCDLSIYLRYAILRMKP